MFHFERKYRRIFASGQSGLNELLVEQAFQVAYLERRVEFLEKKMEAMQRPVEPEIRKVAIPTSSPAAHGTRVGESAPC